MNTSRPTQDIGVLRKHVAALNGAILRVNAALDVATVLREIVDSTRALTASRYGAITTVDESGQVQDLVSSGFSAEQHEAFVAWRDGPKALGTLPRPAGALAPDGSTRLRFGTWLCPGPDECEDLPGHAATPPREAGR